ncbi:hypothetical protein LTR86_008489 [Recurvomyces mirabilis]|nr:hypothetical protein LTR86_008489 [Recurvomyces mirabilis]
MSFWQQVHKPKPLEARERPHQLLWYLAGGRMTADLPNNGVPTAVTLRERRKVEETNREAVGFWGTVRGKRKVKVSRKQLAEAVRRINETSEEAESGSAEEARETAEALEVEASKANKGVEESA